MLFNQDIPEYYDTMFMDGYSPEKILMAKRKQMFAEHEEEQPLNVKLTSVIKIK